MTDEDPDGDVTAKAVHQIGPERQHIWDAQPGDAERIEEHLRRQHGVPVGLVRLDDGREVKVGSDAEGEGEDS